MIHPMLHRQAVALDRNLHRDLRVHQPQPDWSFAATVNALFIAGAEFADACREYPILFVRTAADEQGRPQVLPIVALGLAPDENLYADGTQWRALYLPAMLRAYPFGLGRVGNDARPVLAVDLAWAGLSRTDGTPLFGADGEPSEHLKALQQQLEQFEAEVRRTRELCRLLVDQGLLRDVRFDAEVADGPKLHVDGFLTVDEGKLGQLGDAELLALARNGALGLVHAHLISMGNLRKLVQWRVERGPAGRAAPPATAAA
jgi:hypothetical protein